MRRLILIAHDIRSTHNVGSLLRTAEGLGVEKIYLTGYTPYPRSKDDGRLPHQAVKIHSQIVKTSLGAENMIDWEHYEAVSQVIAQLRSQGFTVVALEQAGDSIALPDYKPPAKLAIIVGNEVKGLGSEIFDKVDLTLEIPMFGDKESFNVVQASAMALYHCRFYV